MADSSKDQPYPGTPPQQPGTRDEPAPPPAPPAPGGPGTGSGGK